MHPPCVLLPTLADGCRHWVPIDRTESDARIFPRACYERNELERAVEPHEGSSRLPAEGAAECLADPVSLPVRANVRVDEHDGLTRPVARREREALVARDRAVVAPCRPAAE